MQDAIQFVIGDHRVRFTPDGRVVVVDAIDALSDTACAACIWEDLQRRHPKLHELCSTYRFAGDEALCVVTADAWDVIEQVLLDYTLENPPE
jgi:hypothetical protein